MSEAMILFLVFGGFFAIIAIVIYISWLQEKKRREAWRQVAAAMGLTFQEKDESLPGLFAEFKLFDRGHSRQATNCLKGGRDGVELVVTDYRYTTGGGKNQTTHYQTVCILTANDLDIPHCFLRKEVPFLDFLGKVFGGQDINFDEDREFSDAFVLQGQNEAEVRQLFNAPVRRAFARHKSSNIQFEARGNTILFYHSQRIEPKEVRQLLQDAFEYLHVFQERLNDGL